jgi:hypothetical protein
VSSLDSSDSCDLLWKSVKGRDFFCGLSAVSSSSSSLFADGRFAERGKEAGPAIVGFTIDVWLCEHVSGVEAWTDVGFAIHV